MQGEKLEAEMPQENVAHECGYQAQSESVAASGHDADVVVSHQVVVNVVFGVS